MPPWAVALLVVAIAAAIATFTLVALTVQHARAVTAETRDLATEVSAACAADEPPRAYAAACVKVARVQRDSGDE